MHDLANNPNNQHCYICGNRSVVVDIRVPPNLLSEALHDILPPFLLVLADGRAYKVTLSVTCMHCNYGWHVDYEPSYFASLDRGDIERRIVALRESLYSRYPNEKVYHEQSN